MIKKFNSFESYKEAPQAIEDLKYILEDEGISVSINGPEVVIRNIYRGISPIFTFLSIYKNGWDTYDIQYSEDYIEFLNRLKDELGTRYDVHALNYGNLLYMIIEIKLKNTNAVQKQAK